MKLLKVLNLRDTLMEEVPECVRFLKSLLFLALPRSTSKQLPAWVNELTSLQHLECESVDRMPKGLSSLASLRTLRSSMLELSIEHDDEFMSLEDLAKMAELQEVQFNVNDERELKKIEGGMLAELMRMRRLRIACKVGAGPDLPLFPDKMKAMKYLESLTLECFGIPSWICELVNLRDLSLTWCECSEYPNLHRMSNLVSLSLCGNESCSELPKEFGSSGGFPHLRYFTIWGFEKLQVLPELAEGAMACLEEFVLWDCPNLKKVPNGLEKLKGLKELNYGCSETNGWSEILKKDGDYWEKIKANNPSITITVRGL